MRCLECGAEVEQLDNLHLSGCCGLTLQEYAIRHHVSLDLLVHESMVNVVDATEAYQLSTKQPSDRANTIFTALSLTNAFSEQDDFFVLDSDVRRLDQLLWYLRELEVFGFQYCQEYQYTDTSHRVSTKNRLKTLVSYAHKFPEANLTNHEIDFDLLVAVIVAQVAEYHNGYIFIHWCSDENQNHLFERLTLDYQIRWVKLTSCDNHCDYLYRTESLEDAQRLLKLIETNLREIPCASERFFASVENALVSKELVFDSAHFITDHPGRCVNLHGGRYTVNVKISGRIDPLTGFVIDYGYLKSVVKQRVLQRLDHQNLNYVCADLGWRSSTELLNIFMWEQLIDYLPGLVELQTYETTQSYCVYQGPTLEELQKEGISPALKHFSQPELGRSVLRKLLVNGDSAQTIKAIT